MRACLGGGLTDITPLVRVSLENATLTRGTHMLSLAQAGLVLALLPSSRDALCPTLDYHLWPSTETLPDVSKVPRWTPTCSPLLCGSTVLSIQENGDRGGYLLGQGHRDSLDFSADFVLPFV